MRLFLDSNFQNTAAPNYYGLGLCDNSVGVESWIFFLPTVRLTEARRETTARPFHSYSFFFSRYRGGAAARPSSHIGHCLTKPPPGTYLRIAETSGSFAIRCIAFCFACRSLSRWPATWCGTKRSASLLFMFVYNPSHSILSCNLALQTFDSTFTSDSFQKSNHGSIYSADALEAHLYSDLLCSYHPDCL